MTPRKQRLVVAIVAFVAVWLVFGLLFGDFTIVYLFAGWAWFLGRVIPQMTFSPAGVGTAALAVALFVWVLHRFMCWLLQAESPDEPGIAVTRWRFRWTATITVLVLVMFTAGIAAVGVVHQIGWIANSPEPMYAGGLRSTAERSQTSDRLKRIAFASFSRADSEGGRLPPSYTTDRQGRRLHGWPTLLLPHLDEKLSGTIEFSKPWNDPANQKTMRQRIDPYLNPSIKDADVDENGYPLLHYAGNEHVFSGTQALRIPADIPDGTANTILFGEIASGFRAWGSPVHVRDPSLGLRKSARTFGGPRWDSTLFVMADGSVRKITVYVSRDVLKALATPAGGETVDAPFD